MEFTLYITNFCPACKRIAKQMNSSNIEYKTVNVEESRQEPPIPLVIFPALLANDKLLAYGSDIITYVENNGVIG